MKIEELTQEQIEKARSLATNEERLDYLKACSVELDDDVLAAVSGGATPGGTSDKCTKNPKNWLHKWEKSGRRRKGRWIGLVDDVEYECVYCHKTYWGLW